MDEFRDYNTQQNKSGIKRQIPYITYRQNLKCDKNNIFTKQKEIHRHREQTWVAKVGEWDGWGAWGQEIQTLTFRRHEQRGPAVQQGELYPITCDRP